MYVFGVLGCAFYDVINSQGIPNLIPCKRFPIKHQFLINFRQPYSCYLSLVINYFDEVVHNLNDIAKSFTAIIFDNFTYFVNVT